MFFAKLILSQHHVRIVIQYDGELYKNCERYHKGSNMLDY